MKVAFAGYRNLLISCVEIFLRSGHSINSVLLPSSDMSIYDAECHSFFKTKNIVIVWDIKDLADSKVDILISINYWNIISPSHLAKFKVGVYNIHHSYLLRYAGRNSCSWAIMDRKENNYLHGTTIHKIDENLDRGQILDSRVIRFSAKTTSPELFARCEDIAKRMFAENLTRMLQGKTNEDLAVSENQVTRYLIDQPSMDITDFSGDLDAFVRAWGYLNDRGPFIIYKGVKLYVSVS